MMKAPPSMHAYVAAHAQGDQRFIFVIFAAMMDDQAGSDATFLAAEAIAPDDPLALAAEKAQGMLAPVVTGTAAAQPFQLDMFAAGAEQGELARPSPLFEKLQAFHRQLPKDGCGIADAASTQANCANAEAGAD
jgi:hypothetical protein